MRPTLQSITLLNVVFTSVVVITRAFMPLLSHSLHSPQRLHVAVGSPCIATQRTRYHLAYKGNWAVNGGCSWCLGQSQQFLCRTWCSLWQSRGYRHVAKQMSVVNNGGEDIVSRVEDGLNPAQREAVCAEVGPVRVVAGPGSGKTRVLTYRIAHLVREVRVPAWSILAVTFTRKAAEEMRSRVRDTLGENEASKIAMGTFHSICARILRRHGDALPTVVPGLDSSFSIFDTDDARRLMTDIFNQDGINKSEHKPADFLRQISKFKSQGLGPEDIDVSQYKGSSGIGKSKHRMKVVEMYSKYQRRLVQSNAVDFDDIILVALKMLQEDQNVFAAVGRRYRHILVDEWQDTNGPQYDLVLALVQAGLEAQLAREDTRHAAAIAIDETERGHRAGGIELNSDPPSPSIFVVGDTDQCIYRFRGANYTNVARFEEDFAGCRTVLLRENYRSTANIARAASAVIERVENRMKQPTKSVQGDGLPIGIMRCSDAVGEALAVANQVEAYLKSGRVPAFEMAVMYRTNAQSRSFEEAFLRKVLPFVVIGAQRFYERREVKDCLVYLRLAANPRDGVAMRRAINTPPRGIGAKTEMALKTLFINARGIPGLESVTGPECLMALLDAEELDDLQAALVCLADGDTAVAAEVSNVSEDVLDDGGGTWVGQQVEAEGGFAGGWRDFSVERARMLGGALAAGDVEGPTRSQVKKLAVFARLLCKLRLVAATNGVPEVLRTVLEETDMERYVTQNLNATAAEGLDRWQNVLELKRAAANEKFSGVAGGGALDTFLNEVALLSGDETIEGRKQREEEMEEARGMADVRSETETMRPPMIQLMTCHASKGLEFNTVFLTGMEEGTFPMELAREGELDEERRLMYVGMTRAKERLFMSWREERMVFTSKGARRQRSHRSHFLDDIPPGIVRSIDKTTPGLVPPLRTSSKGSSRCTIPGRRRTSSTSSSPGSTMGSFGTSSRASNRRDSRNNVPTSLEENSIKSARRMSDGWCNDSSVGRGMDKGYGREGGDFRQGGGRGDGRAGGTAWSDEARAAHAFRSARDKIEVAKYPVPLMRDRGARLSEEVGVGIDMSWAADLENLSLETSSATSKVQVGAQVSHPVHGPGQVVALVDGTEAINVRFLSKGEPFVARVSTSKLEVLE